MKRLFVILAAALVLFGCGKKPAHEKVAEELGYQDFTALTPDGQELSLSDLVGQTDYVLVDFWASWCNPCRRFIPVLKELYASQPEGRLQIISCSVDQDIMAWQVALSEEQMPWPQVREDENHVCSDLYEVQFIPHTVLIDRAGQIVGVNLEEPEIEALLLGE
jgi:thiol-disulfide isomerase/thioredoxin